jgi:hypothetical protein
MINTESKLELREFIKDLTQDVGTKFIKGQVDYEEVGQTLVLYLNILFTLFNGLIQDLDNMKRRGKVIPPKYLNDVRKIIVDNILNLEYPLNVNKIKAGVERLKNVYDLDESKLDTAIKVLSNTKSILLGVAAFLGAVHVITKFISSNYNKIKKMQDDIMSNKELKSTYKTIMEPSFVRILDEVLSQRLKSKPVLKKRFYNTIDKLGKFNPLLAPYLSAWMVN